ncbi:MAG: CRTAC1 family protein [Ardenticatenales bacterium]|nr:CRTAC1 family protein [Ardenticatenales bacterium]
MAAPKALTDRGRAAAAPTLLILLATACTPPTPWFVDIAPSANVPFAYHTGATGRLWMPEVMGGGVALFDYDADGDLDLYFTNGNDRLPQAVDAAEGAGPTDRLYRRDPDGRYTDVTAAAHIADNGYGMGVAAADYDNDGHVDLYVAAFGPDHLLHNQGDGTFADVSASAGITETQWSSAAAWLDYDRDGWLDLYVARYIAWRPDVPCQDRDGNADYCGPAAFADVRDMLWHNEGGARFTDATERAGIDRVTYAGLGVTVDDFDDDGWPDLFVANDGDPNVLWRNRGDGTFDNVAVPWGAAYNLTGEAEAGMGVVADDLTGDGQSDVVVTHLHAETNTFYARRTAGAGFDDLTLPSGLGLPSYPLTGFGIAAFDAELDGDLDIAIANGRVHRSLPALPGAAPAAPWDALAEPKLLQMNDGTGRFDTLDIHHANDDGSCGLCADIDIARGLAPGDLDSDGDLDLVVANIESPARLYDNRAPRQGHWLAVRAVDPRLKRDAIGARVIVDAGGRRHRRFVRTSGSYQSSVPATVHVGLGVATAVDGIAIWWPDGLEESFEVDCVDCAVELRRGEGVVAP